MVLTDLMWSGLGIFLVLNYFWKKKEEETTLNTDNISNNPDTLDKKQNRIFGYILIIGFIGSIDFWVTNNYLAGVTFVNLFVILDILVNLFFVYFIFNLFKNKINVTKPLLYWLIVYNLIWAVVEGFRYEWIGVISSILPIIYFLYAVKSNRNLKNYRISNYVILPLMVIFTVSLSYFAHPTLRKLFKDESRLEKEYNNASTDAGNAYAVIFKKDTINSVDVQNIEDKVVIVEEKINRLLLALDELEKEQNKQFPSTEKLKTLENIDQVRTIQKIFLEQAKKIKEFMDYLQTVNLNSLTENQKLEISRYVNTVEAYNSQARDVILSFEK